MITYKQLTYIIFLFNSATISYSNSSSSTLFFNKLSQIEVNNLTSLVIVYFIAILKRISWLSTILEYSFSTSRTIFTP